MNTEEFLEHHGVKGQKWGVRHDPGHEGERVKTKHFPKLDQQWMDKINKPKGWDTVAVHNRVADKVNANIDAFNKKPEYKNAHLDNPNSPATKKYMRDFENMQTKYYKEAVNEVHGVSPSGAFRAHFEKSANGWHIRIRGAHVEHAITSLDDLDFEVNLDTNGLVSLIKKLPSVMKQSEKVTNNFLEHFGIKGMHWGIRNNRFSRSKQQHRKTSQDYRKARQLKKRGPASLSNKQLEEVNKRLNLEKNYKNLNPNALERIKKEKKTVEAILSVTAGVTSVAALAQTDRGKKAISVGKTVLDKVLSNLGSWYNMRGAKEVGTLFDARKF